MTSTTFFIIFIPILSFILLFVNLLLASHNPYQEKDSVFECGFHSFLGQNRTQFSVSFFIFGLLFLLFDLEIILVYPYSVSGYNNDIYGLAIMMLFFILLTLGFIFELGKNALTIDSRQTITYHTNETPDSEAFLNGNMLPLTFYSVIAKLTGCMLSCQKKGLPLLVLPANTLWNTTKFLALMVVALFFLYISWILGLRVSWGAITTILFFFIINHIGRLIGENNNITRRILILFIVVEGIILYYSTQSLTPINFYCNHSSLSFGVLLIFYSTIAKMIYSIVYNKRNMNYFVNLEKSIKNIFILLKEKPLTLLTGLLCLLVIFFSFNVVCNILGLSISTQSFLEFILTLVCKISFFSWINLIYRLPKIKNREEFYNTVGMSPYLPISLIPFGYCYFTYLLPEIITLNARILPIVNTRIALFINLFQNTSFKFYFFKTLQELGQFFTSMRNRPGQLGKLFTCLANWGLGDTIESVSRKRYPFNTNNYTAMLGDFLEELKYNLTKSRSNIRYWNYVKSKPQFSPIKIYVPESKLVGFHPTIYVKDSLSNLYIKVFANYRNVITLFSQAKFYKFTDIHLIVSDHTIQFNFKEDYTGVDIKIQSYDGKPQNHSFDFMSYLKNLAEKEYMDNIVSKSNKDLQVYVQKQINVNNLNEQESSSSYSIEGSSTKKRNIGPSEGESSDLNKKKRVAFDNTASNNPESNNVSIIREDFLENDFKYDIVYSKITNFIAQEGINKRDTINKLSFEPNSLKIDFYRKLEALNLTNYKYTGSMKIESLIKTLEDFIHITPINPNSIIREDFLENDFKYDIVYSKITNFIAQEGINKKDTINKLSFEPDSLKKHFYRKLEALNLTNSREASSITIGILQNTLKQQTDLIKFKDGVIMGDDILPDFNYNTVYNKIIFLIDSGEVNSEKNISHLIFESKELKDKFYDQIILLGLTNNSYIHASTIKMLMQGLEKYIDITTTNPNSINKEDFWEDSLKFEVIYDKISKLIYSNPNLDKNSPISRLEFEPESLRKDFYRKLEALNLTNSREASSITIGILQNTLKQQTDLIKFKDGVIMGDDILPDFDYNTVYNKIYFLIESGEVNSDQHISNLKFYPITLKQSFYESVELLELVSKASESRIRNLIQGLEKYLDIYTTNPNSINKEDFWEDSLNYKSIYQKISNLILDDQIKTRDRLNKLIFEPESLRKVFYAKVTDLNLSSYKEVWYTRINNLQNTLENKILEQYTEGFSTNGNSIKKEDILEEGLDYISVYIKIANFIKDNNIGTNDILNKLIFEPESLRKVFYDRLKDSELTDNSLVRRTRLINLKDRLRNKIVKEYI